MQGPGANGLFGNVGHILSVSGGSYIAASRALVARDLKSAAPPAYGPGTPEEQHLRDNTHYIAPNAGVVLVGVLSLLVGVVVTFILVFAPVFAVAHAWGWLLRWQKVLCPGSVRECGAPGPFVASVTSPGWWWLVPTAAAGLTLLLFGCWWVTLKPQREERQAAVRREAPRTLGDTLATFTGWAALVAAVLALAMLVAPLLLSWVAKLPAGPFKSLVYDLGFGSGHPWTPAALTGVFAALVAVAQSCRAKLAQLQLPSAQGKPASQTKAQTQQQDPAQPGFLAGLGARIQTYALPWVASAVIVLVAIVAGLRWVKDGPLRPGEVARPWAHGPFTRIQDWQGAGGVPGAPGLPGTGSIWVCKLGWWAGAPWDVRAYAGQHSEFPGQSTMQQLYDAAEFDAYRVLGLSAVDAALKGGLGPMHPRPPWGLGVLDRWMKPADGSRPAVTRGGRSR